jgi:hypothetical protein
MPLPLDDATERMRLCFYEPRLVLNCASGATGFGHIDCDRSKAAKQKLKYFESVPEPESLALAFSVASASHLTTFSFSP